MSIKLKSGFTFDYDNLFGEGKVTKADIEAFGEKLKEAHKAMNVMRETGVIKVIYLKMVNLKKYYSASAHIFKKDL